MIELDSQVDSVDLSLSQSTLVVGTSNLEGNFWDGALSLISVDSGEIINSRRLRSGVSLVRYAGADKNCIIAARDDGLIDMYSSELNVIQVFEGHDDSCISICGDNTSVESKFFSAGWDNCIHTWDWNSSTPTLPVYSIYDAHFGRLNGIASDGGKLIGSVGSDGFLRLWDQRKPAQSCVSLFDMGQSASCLSWVDSSDCFVAVGAEDGKVFSLDIRSNSKDSQQNLSCCAIHSARVEKLVSIPNREGVLLSVSDDTSIGIIKVQGGCVDSSFDRYGRHSLLLIRN